MPEGSEEGREADAAATGNESDYFPEEGDDTTDGGGTDRTAGGSGGAARLLRRRRRSRWRQGRTGRRKCLPTS